MIGAICMVLNTRFTEPEILKRSSEVEWRRTTDRKNELPFRIASSVGPLGSAEDKGHSVDLAPFLILSAIIIQNAAAK